MIRDVDAVTLDGILDLLYGGLAASVAAGVVLGLTAVYLSVAARGGDSS